MNTTLCNQTTFDQTNKQTKQNKTKQNKTKQDKTRQNKTKQDKTRQNKTKQDKTRQNKTKQDKTRQNKTKQDKTRQNKTKQDKTRQNKTKQDKTDKQTNKQTWRCFLHEANLGNLPTIGVFQVFRLAKHPVPASASNIRKSSGEISTLREQLESKKKMGENIANPKDRSQVGPFFGMVIIWLVVEPPIWKILVKLEIFPK